MTSPGALNVCQAGPVDSPAASAPSPGNAGGSRAFGQQLRDAHESMSSHSDDNAAEGTSSPKRAAARGTEKRGSGDGDAKISIPVQVPTQSVPALPISLDLALMPAKDSEANGSTDSQNAGGRQGAVIADSTGQPKPRTELPPAPDPLAGTTQAVAMPKELTFALKLDPHTDVSVKESVKDNSKIAKEGIASKIPAPVKSSAAAVKAVEDAQRAEPQTDTAAPRTDAFSRVSAFLTNAPNPSSSSPEAGTQARLEPAKALETAALQIPATDATSKAAGPLKELSIQVGQTPQERVELRIVDRSGEVQVAVRSSNPDVAQGLRQGLSDLVGRLEQNGYRAEAWRPGGTVTSIQGTGESRQKEMQFQRDGSQSQSGGSQQGRQQNSQNQTYRPRWVQELEGSLSDGSNSNSGDFYGITS